MAPIPFFALALSSPFQLFLLFHQSFILFSPLFLDVAVHQLDNDFNESFRLDFITVVFENEDFVGSIKSCFPINDPISEYFLILRIFKIKVIFIKYRFLLASIDLGR